MLGTCALGGADAAIGVLTAYNSWTGWPALDAAGPETAEAVTDLIVYALDEWRSALCDEAAVVDAVCVDLLEPFNGPRSNTRGRPARGRLHPPVAAGQRPHPGPAAQSSLYPLPEASPATP